jgi:pSer/pThr/pTyr-binding forkhead associated (FHA) protein
VTLDERGATLEDLGSKNGTRVGDDAVTGSVRLENGDTIHVGPAVLIYRMSEGVLTTETQTL